MTVKAPQQQAAEGFDAGEGGDYRDDDSDEEHADFHADSSMWSASGTDVNMLRSGLYGLGASIAFYLIVLPFRDFYFGELFLERQWVPYVLVFLMSWSIAILYLKSQKLSRQKDSMLFDMLPTDISDRITARNASQFISHIRSLPTNPNESFLVNRVLRGLEHFRVLQSNPEVAGRLASQSEIDATAVESSYTTLKVFIWAIPILGFIGTVIGIGTAVSGFSEKLGGTADITELKDSLNVVTGGLATAFDTTLIALVMSLLVMFPTSSVQKSEEDLLNWVDEYCNENLLRRLKDVDRGVGATTSAADHSRTIQKAVDAAMTDHHAELRAWSQKLEGIGGEITGQVTRGWQSIGESDQARHTQNMQQVEGVVASVMDRQREMAAQLASFQQEVTRVQKEQNEKFSGVIQAANEEARTIQQRGDDRQTQIESNLTGLVDQFEKTLTGLAEQSESVQNQVSTSMQSASESLSRSFSALEQGLASLNSVLEGLGQKQVVLSQPSDNQGRRGWGLFRRKSNGAG